MHICFAENRNVVYISVFILQSVPLLRSEVILQIFVAVPEFVYRDKGICINKRLLSGTAVDKIRIFIGDYHLFDGLRLWLVRIFPGLMTDHACFFSNDLLYIVVSRKFCTVHVKVSSKFLDIFFTEVKRSAASTEIHCKRSSENCSNNT